MSRRTSLGQGFSDAISRFALASGRNIEEVHTATTLRLFRAVILSTPVLTGRLRGNWQTTVGSPASGVTESSEAACLVQLGNVIEAHQPGETLLLTNNLPYAARIEYDGWSHTKAPRGMVRINVTRFKRLLQQETRRVRNR